MVLARGLSLLPHRLGPLSLTAGAALLLLAGMGGCSRPASHASVEAAPTRHSAAPRVVPQAATTAHDTRSVLRATIRNLERTRCAERRCCATELAPLGTETTSSSWVVALENERECLFGAAQADADVDSAVPGPSESDTNASRPTCTEYWLLKNTDAPRALDGACDDERWEGHFELDARNEQLTYYGSSLYSNTRVHEERVLGLNPVRWLETRHSSQDYQLAREEHWSWERFAGELTLGIDPCNRSNAAPSAALDSDSPLLEVRALKIPRLGLPPPVLSAWRTTSIERCAARVDGESGFILSTGPNSPHSSSFSAAFVGADVLLLQIDDDRFVGRESSARVHDEIEILGSSAPANCAEPRSRAKLTRFSIGVLDGSVRASKEEKSRPVVEVARGDGVVRLKLTFAPPLSSERLTLVYRDTDDGRAYQRIIATSELDANKWWTLGETPAQTESLSCELDGGALRPVMPVPGNMPELASGATQRGTKARLSNVYEVWGVGPERLTSTTTPSTRFQLKEAEPKSTKNESGAPDVVGAMLRPVTK